VIGDPGDPGEPDDRPVAAGLQLPARDLARRRRRRTAQAGRARRDARPIGAAIAADRTLGGLCEYLDCGAAELGSREGEMVTGLNWASLPIIAEYSTNNPLG
jgi:hypothetical protein